MCSIKNKCGGKMNTFKKIILSAVIALVFTAFGGIANAACGKVVIASQNWASAELMAEVDKVILEKRFMVAKLNLFRAQRCQHLLQWMKKVLQI